MQRRPVNKKRAAKQFRREVKRTKAVNLCATSAALGPMRGGWRL